MTTAFSRVRDGLLDPLSSTIFVVLGQSNWQATDQGTSSWFPVVNAFPQVFKVGRWGGLWPTPCGNGVTQAANFCRAIFDTTSCQFGTVRIGDDTLNSTAYHGLVPMYYVNYTGNVAINTRNLRLHFAPPDLSQTWATAPTLFGSTTQESEMVMLYMSTATGMPAASTPRLNATRSASTSAAATQAVSNNVFNWASPGDGSIASTVIDFSAATSSGLYPILSLNSNNSDETGALAMSPYLRLKATPGTQIIPCGRGNFGYVASLSTAPGAGWTDSTNNLTDAGLDQCLAAFKTASYDHLVFIDCIGAADVVDGALPVDLADTIGAFHTRLRAAGATAGFTTTEVVHVMDAPITVLTDEPARSNELNNIKRTMAGDNSELFVSLWDYFGRKPLPASWMSDDRHQTEYGAVQTARALWYRLTARSSPAIYRSVVNG